ncbi:MAG: hypothetical protein ABEJ99_00350 [Candidatus Nanohaloarchaea archaeon]
MALDVIDTITSSFKDLTTPHGAKVIASMIGLAIVNAVSMYLSNMQGSVTQLVGGLLAILYLVFGAVFLVGVFRTFSERSFELSQYTENVAWPFYRYLVSGSSLAGILGAVTMLIAGFGLMLSIGQTSPAAGALGMLSAFQSTTFRLGLLVSVIVGVYIYTTLVLAFPSISIRDGRAFEALDNAVQRSKGERLRMFLSAVPYLVILALVGVVDSQFGTSMPTITAYVNGALSLIGAAYNFALLAQLEKRL